MSTEKFKRVMIIPHLTCWTLHYIFSSLCQAGPSAPLKADLTGAGIGRWEVQLSKLLLWPGDAVARHKPQTSGCLATRLQSRDHQAQTRFTAGCHTDTITEMAKKTLRDTFAQAGRWNWLAMCFKHFYQRAIKASQSKRRDSLNMWHSYAFRSNALMQNTLK